MKKFIIIGLLAALVVGLAIFFAGNGQSYSTDPADANAYLRVHIRANSNSAADQEVKYKVRDEVVNFLTPIVAECTSKEAAMEKIGANLEGAARVADETLKRYGYTYGARASLRQEEFPTRVYQEATLTAGIYDALILELGTGEGDNWWCVVYPPLCFGGGNCKIEYKSKIAEIIKKFFG